MRILISLLISITFFSCENTATQENKDHIVDTITSSEEKEVIIPTDKWSPIYSNVKARMSPVGYKDDIALFADWSNWNELYTINEETWKIEKVYELPKDERVSFTNDYGIVSYNEKSQKLTIWDYNINEIKSKNLGIDSYMGVGNDNLSKIVFTNSKHYKNTIKLYDFEKDSLIDLGIHGGFRPFLIDDCTLIYQIDVDTNQIEPEDKLMKAHICKDSIHIDEVISSFYPDPVYYSKDLHYMITEKNNGDIIIVNTNSGEVVFENSEFKGSMWAYYSLKHKRFVVYNINL